MTQESEAYQIETWDAANNKTTRRTIQPLPQPTRLQHPAPIEKAELTEMIDSLRNEMGEQQSRFDHKDELDAERNQKRAALSSRIGEVTLQLREAQGELDQLNRKKTNTLSVGAWCRRRAANWGGCFRVMLTSHPLRNKAGDLLLTISSE